MSTLQILLIALIIIGIIFLIFLKRNQLNPAQTQKDPIEVIFEALIKFRVDQNTTSPLVFIHALRYIKRETGMGLLALLKHLKNQQTLLQKLDNPQFVQNVNDMLQSPESEYKAVKYVQEQTGLNMNTSEKIVLVFKKKELL
ncbi:hypothetical protein [Gracilibacillus alcaliphilus]|uniref:hypothetical protein n=1 Tax=Gracilibacillus alcaliphilus TaxID=1401441 RepID=UPI00195AD3C1|nr:hypothetical protein [Gracilibacillus alcaliphilus]MBM7675730.1 hypothetical protein [Gracilibacillus alcaliphilus]